MGSGPNKRQLWYWSLQKSGRQFSLVHVPQILTSSGPKCTQSHTWHTQLYINLLNKFSVKKPCNLSTHWGKSTQDIILAKQALVLCSVSEFRSQSNGESASVMGTSPSTQIFEEMFLDLIVYLQFLNIIMAHHDMDLNALHNLIKHADVFYITVSFSPLHIF